MASTEKLVVGALVKQALMNLSDEELAEYLQMYSQQSENRPIDKFRRMIRSTGGSLESLKGSLGQLGKTLNSRGSIGAGGGQLTFKNPPPGAGGRFSQDRMPLPPPDLSISGATQGAINKMMLSPLGLLPKE